MSDLLRQLPHATWRGIILPIRSRSVNFSHESVQHKLQYVDGDLVEQLGARALTFRYSLAMREDIASGPYDRLFSRVYPQLYLAMRDRSRGELVDPLLGRFDCVPTSWGDETDVTLRDGTEVTVEFMHSPDEAVEALQDAGLANIKSLESETRTLDDAVAVILRAAQRPSAEPMTDPLSAINGIGQQILRAGDKLSAALADVAYRAEKIEQTLDELQNPQVWPVRQSVRRVRDTATRLAQRAQQPTREIVTVVRRFSTTVAALAADSGMTVQELLQLNPRLALDPTVPAGASVRVFR